MFCSFSQFSLIKFEFRCQLLLKYFYACATSLKKNVSLHSKISYVDHRHKN